MVDPFKAVSASQRKARELAAEAVNNVVKAGTTAVGNPEEAIHRLTTLVAAIGDLAASTTKPLEVVISNQRALSNAMASFAQLQADLAVVVEQMAQSHAAVIDALETLATPALAVSELIRTDPAVKKAQQKAKS